MDSEIQRLTLEVEDRRESAESWDAWNIRILSIAGFAALLLVITAIGVSRSNRELLRSSDELDRAKDSKLALELRTKDEEIARAQQLAAEAKQKAEAEQLARVKIEEKMAPRHLSPEQRKSMATKLLQFGGQKVQIVTFSGDSEIARIADDVMAALNGANDGARWNVVTRISGTAPVGNIDGILVEVEPNADVAVQNAASALAVALRAERLAVTGPNLAPSVKRYSGATIEGGMNFGDTTVITVTIARKP